MVRRVAYRSCQQASTTPPGLVNQKNRLRGYFLNRHDDVATVTGDGFHAGLEVGDSDVVRRADEGAFWVRGNESANRAVGAVDHRVLHVAGHGFTGPTKHGAEEFLVAIVVVRGEFMVLDGVD
jgi:hypothetical protein